MGSYDADTKFDGKRVHLTWPDKTANICVTGSAINKSDGAWVDGIKKVRKTAATSDDLEFVKSNVINAISLQLESLERKKIAVKSGNVCILSDKPMVQVFYSLFEQEINENAQGKPYYIHPWAEGTQHAHIVYFYKNILPIIQDYEYDSDFTAVEKEDLINHLAKVALKRMDNKDDLNGARATAIMHMNEGDRIYSEMRYNSPSLPDIDLRVEQKRKRKRTEQLKRLPYEIHKNFRELVEVAIKDEPYYARAAILMDSGGERSGEASAAMKCDFEDYGDFIISWILVQENKGKRIDRLKSKDAYRYVVLDEWGTRMLRKCNQRIGDEAPSDNSPVKDTDLSGWVRNKLREAGCSDEYLRDAYDDMVNYPEYTADGRPVRDIAAHILRRNRASIWRNYCGYTQEELDYALGHVNRKGKFEKDNVLDPKTFVKLAYKNSRYDMFPEYSINPKHKPFCIEKGKEISMIPFDVFRVKNDTDSDLELEFDFLAMEANEIITIETPEGTECNFNLRSTPSTDFHRREAYIIGSIDEQETNKETKERSGEYEESEE